MVRALGIWSTIIRSIFMTKFPRVNLGSSLLKHRNSNTAQISQAKRMTTVKEVSDVYE